jgi:nicotinic acid phosphoribosyltransferase
MLYPDAVQMSAYGSFRKPFVGMDDNRFVFYGIRYIIETYVSNKWTVQDVQMAEHFYNTYNVGHTVHPFPKELFLKFIKENDGYFPVTIQALPEATVAYIGTPVYQITAKGVYTPLVTFLETILTHVWYGSNVATLSRMSKDIISKSFDKSVDDECRFLLDSRLHDFGFRGCASVEQSMVGGAAHLLNFTGSDTMSASFYVQFHLNNGTARASSIPATEHSNMTAWPTERDAFDHATNQFGHGVFATVMDSNDYDKACDEIAPKFADRVKDKGGLWVWRPDSGEPVEAVLKGLTSAEKAFGSVINKKGYKVLNNCAIIQGDGINQHTIREIADAVIANGFSAQNVAYGMGAGLLQKHNRDTMSFATKLSHIEYTDGTKKNVMKAPKTDSSKVSLPGRIDVCYDPDGSLKTYPAEVAKELGLESAFVTVYDNKPIEGVWESFETLVNRVEQQWSKTPNGGNPYSEQMLSKISTTLSELHSN